MFGTIIPESIRQLFKKAATNLYPFEKFPTPEGFNGKLVADISKCIGCKMCVRDCPAQAIQVSAVGEKKFKIDIFHDRCINCGQCVDVCPTDTLSMTSEHEISAYSRKDLKSEFI